MGGWDGTEQERMGTMDARLSAEVLLAESRARVAPALEALPQERSLVGITRA